MSVYAIGQVMERSELKGYYLINSEVFGRKYFDSNKLLALYQKEERILPVTNLVLNEEQLVPLWEGGLGLPRYDRAGVLIGKAYEQGVYLTMSINTQHCEPPVGIGHWQVTLYKDGFLQYLPAVTALNEGYKCVEEVMDEIIPVDGDILSIINVLESNDNILEVDGMKLLVEMDNRGLATVTVLEIGDNFTGNLKLNIKCKALLKFSMGDYGSTELTKLTIGNRIEQICLHALSGIKVKTFSIEGCSRYTIDIAIGTNAKRVDLRKSTGLIVDERVTPKCNFGTELEYLTLPDNLSTIYYPTNRDNNLRILEVGSRANDISIQRQLEDFLQLENLVLPEVSSIGDVAYVKEQVLSLHMRNTEVTRVIAKIGTTKDTEQGLLEVKL